MFEPIGSGGLPLVPNGVDCVQVGFRNGGDASGGGVDDSQLVVGVHNGTDMVVGRLGLMGSVDVEERLLELVPAS